jgi:hypothetical protein
MIDAGCVYEELRTQACNGGYVVLDVNGTEETKGPEPWLPVKWWSIFQILVRCVVCEMTYTRSAWIPSAIYRHCGLSEQFVTGAHEGSGQDDLLFCALARPRGDGKFVVLRREEGQLPLELAYGSELYKKIDWRGSVYLNIAMHTRYRLTVCSGG